MGDETGEKPDTRTMRGCRDSGGVFVQRVLSPSFDPPVTCGMVRTAHEIIDAVIR